MIHIKTNVSNEIIPESQFFFVVAGTKIHVCPLLTLSGCSSQLSGHKKDIKPIQSVNQFCGGHEQIPDYVE